MLDGEETVEIACGELRWEGAIYSMLDGEETVERGGSDTTCWTERKPWK